jgi:hypothetical protein
MGPRDFFQFNFIKCLWIGIGIDYFKGMDKEQRPLEINFYLPFMMFSFAFKI